ncbi:DUF982 domain-containing protein [Pseudaminobacter arsenicus]|uniref:DUF982 domain-containing protein n=1 Tax=Borborobacter arsenicus TaxID=1851146 RepID=A0A432V3C9_9HYPH|nr:DUF982 domain-containing protein [Pseudaminobacter arsenicus]RUM96542.1 DUF982 domain-containing protein [Pseudaminobacter arsenicus]
MDDDRQPFGSPVRVRIGADNTIRDVKTVKGACECLTDWPQAKRGQLYREAFETCNAVLAGERSAEDARAAFVAAAEESGLLANR